MPDVEKYLGEDAFMRLCAAMITISKGFFFSIDIYITQYYSRTPLARLPNG